MGRKSDVESINGVARELGIEIKDEENIENHPGQEKLKTEKRSDDLQEDSENPTPLKENINCIIEQNTSLDDSGSSNASITNEESVTENDGENKKSQDVGNSLNQNLNIMKKKRKLFQ